MNLREQILKEHTRANCNRMVKWIGDSQERFDELFALFLNGEYRVLQRAAWPLSDAVIAHPKLIQKHFASLLRNLKRPGLPVAVKRNTVRLLQEVEIPKKFQGTVMDTCFRFIAAPDETVAVKAFSLTVLENLSRRYPDIIPEIKLLIEENDAHEAAAFKTRAKKLLQSPAFNR
jgi:hypothetical protein